MTIVRNCCRLLGRLWSQSVIADSEYRLVVAISPIPSGRLLCFDNFHGILPSRYVLRQAKNCAINQLTNQDSPRALVKQGRMEEARDVIDMLSLEGDADKREDSTVRIIFGEIYTAS